MPQIITSTSQSVNHLNEHILVVKTDSLFPNGAWQGLKQIDFDDYATLITNNQEFLPRSQMEINPAYKQIIPYLIFQYQDCYFLMQRQSKASETRLQSKYTLGIGGHIRLEDMRQGTSIADWAKREFHEEVNYKGSLNIQPLGMLNDDSNEVGKVHTGFVIIMQGDSNQISIKSELNSGMLLSLNECKPFIDRMETWSQIVIDYLIQK